MFEVNAALQGFEVDHLDNELLLDLVEEDTHARRRADRRRLRLAWQFITNTTLGPDQDDHAGWAEGLSLTGDELIDTLGGEGTPWIHVDAPVQWALAIGRSVTSAKHYLANTMDLHVRFPKLHARVDDLAVEVWTAFDVAETTRGLSLECARWIDDHLAEAGHYGQKTRDLWIKSGIARFHPDLVKDTSRLDRDDWDVRVDHNPDHTPGGGTGTSTLEAIGDSLDLAKFLDAVSDEAATAARLGDTDTLGQRKAKALGAIADRQATLDLAGLLDIPHSDPDDPENNGDPRTRTSAAAGSGTSGSDGMRPSVNANGDLIHPETGMVVHRKKSYGQVKIHLHLTKDDLDAFLAGDQTRTVDAGRLGPQTLARITAWLRTFGPDAKIAPIIDLGKQWSVDQHDPPEQMRAQVIARDRHCIFPGCTVDSRHCDLDHIEAYDEHGPPGQTDPDKLAPLCRRHHLIKTHTRWRYRRNRDGTYTWTSPFARTWLVTPEGTIDATDP